jgi:flavin reductase (DIM6/NTAB) family NADH-FMN oxidoreductase RutF
MTISPETFKAAMGQLASGVTIVTMRAGDEDHGFTASSFTSLSIDPMLVLVCVVKAQRSHALIEEAQHFAVNILSTEQRDLGMRFASSKTLDRFAGIDVIRASTGAPILGRSLAWVDCKLKDAHPGGDHSIFVGEVVAAEVDAGRDALLYFNRQWGTFSPSTP